MKKKLLAYLTLVLLPVGIHRLIVKNPDKPWFEYPGAVLFFVFGVVLWAPPPIPTHAQVVLALPFVAAWVSDFLTMWSWNRRARRADARAAA